AERHPCLGHARGKGADRVRLADARPLRSGQEQLHRRHAAQDRLTMKGRRRLLAGLRHALFLVAAVALPSTARRAQAKTDDMVDRQAMTKLFDKHVNAELAGDLDSTMATMSDAPHLNHVPTMAGGIGRDGVRAFYRDHLVGKFFPPDMKMTSISRTVGENGVVDEVVIKFTHTTAI